MARKKTSARKRGSRRVPRAPDACAFCKVRKVPDYKDYEELRPYLTDRARILATNRSGICSKHQRKVTSAIKRARHLGLLPFAPHL